MARMWCVCQLPDCVQADGNEITGSTFACCLRSDCLTSDRMWGGSHSCPQGRLNSYRSARIVTHLKTSSARQAPAAKQHWLIYAWSVGLTEGWLASYQPAYVSGWLAAGSSPCQQLVVGGGAAGLCFPFVRVEGAEEQLIGLGLVLAARLGGGRQQEAVAGAEAAQK